MTACVMQVMQRVRFAVARPDAEQLQAMGVLLPPQVHPASGFHVTAICPLHLLLIRTLPLVPLIQACRQRCTNSKPARGQCLAVTTSAQAAESRLCGKAA